MREEKSLRHVAMVAKFLDDNKPKTSLIKWICTVSNFDDLIAFLLICQMLTKFSGVKSVRTASKFRKRERKFCVKRVRKIRKFHLAALQRRLRNIQKRVMHVQSCCFANINLLLFSSSLCRRRCRVLSSLLLWATNFVNMVTWRQKLLLSIEHKQYGIYMTS